MTEQTTQEGNPMDEIIRNIARRVLGIRTLKERNSDRLDFHEVGVLSVKEALEEAYRAGAASAHGPTCPYCGEDEPDRLVWDDEAENVSCASCQFCWSPDEPLVNHAVVCDGWTVQEILAREG